MLLFAELLSGGQLIVVGILLVGAAVILRRGAAGGKRARNRDPLREVHEEFRQAESSYSAQLNQMEVRLHEFARDVEGRVYTRLAVLDQLVLDADREIDRLERLLNISRGDSSGSAPVAHSGPDIVIVPQSPPAIDLPLARRPAGDATENAAIHSDSPRGVYALYDAGFSPQEIAQIVGQPVSRVVLVLNQRPAPGQSDAA